MKLELSDNDVLELKILHRAERDRKKCDRIKAILMFNKGYSAVEIGTVLLIDENTVSGWKDRYLKRKNTQEWLRTQCIGYQGKLDKDQESQIDTYVQENLVSDARQVQSFIKKEFKKTYTISGVIELLHRLGFNYKQTTLMPAKIDPEKQAQFKSAYDEFKKNLKEDEVLLFLDGVHPQHNTKCSRAWIKIGEQKQIKSNSGRRRLNISGAYDPISQDILVREDKPINAETVMAFFKQIEAAYPSKASIYVIADQAPYYQNKDVKKYLETSRVELIALPTYSPNLNLIERLWKLMRKKVINNIYYEKFADFKHAILAFFSNDSLEFKAELRLFIGLDLHLLHSP